MKTITSRFFTVLSKPYLGSSLALAVFLMPLTASAVESINTKSDTKAESQATAVSPAPNETASQANNNPTVIDNQRLSTSEGAKSANANVNDDLTQPLSAQTSEPNKAAATNIANTGSETLAPNNPSADPQSQANNTTLAVGNLAQDNLATTTATADTTAAPNAAAAPTTDKALFGVPLTYLLSGLIALLALGLAFLFSQLRALATDNQDLAQNHNKLAGQVNSNNKKLKQLSDENIKLNQELRQLHQRLPTQHQPQAEEVIAPVMVAPHIEDLNSADRHQLASIFTNWLLTNRGGSKIEDVIPADIKQKLQHWHYAIQFWSQGDGVDAIKPTKNPTYASVISLSKPDQSGFGYCYNRPNNLSSLWKNQTWYQIQNLGQTLNVLGNPLETV